MMRSEKASFPVSFMCRQLSVSRSGYYAWEKRPVSKRQQEDVRLLELIEHTHKDNRGTYGSPRITDVLKDLGETVGRHKVASIMRKNGIIGLPPKKFRKTTDSDHNLPVAENLLDREFDVECPNEAWVGDITYIWTARGWVYLAVILDLFSRRVVGWALDDHMRSELVLKALEMAIGHRDIMPGAIFHSDRGSQYASDAHQRALERAGMVQSMSHKGDCWDNAVAESFFATIKRELINRCFWINKTAVRSAVHEYIEVFYNRKRKHSTNGNICPVEYERLYINKAAVAA